ncbi:unnamed protein product [Auanema sp. JU1783]|nr:unnamed protein product [Auanema sp. JU1783]
MDLLRLSVLSLVLIGFVFSSPPPQRTDIEPAVYDLVSNVVGQSVPEMPPSFQDNPSVDHSTASSVRGTSEGLSRFFTPFPMSIPIPYYDPYNKGQDHENKDDTALRLGIGIGCGLFSALVVFLCIFCCWYRRCRRKQRNNMLFPIVVPRQNSYVKQEDSPPIVRTDPWELPRTSLIIDYEHKLGSGAFCNVFFGKIIGEAPVAQVFPGVRTVALHDCEVAVKMLPSFADEIARSDFMQEINFMKSLAYHPHLVSMLGYVADTRSPLLLVEYCERGDLLHYIRERRAEIKEGPQGADTTKIKDLLSFAWQISNGLEYLNSVGCIHRDIAARNVLVDGVKQCKIADFGLCRLTDSLLYTARGGRLPLKWMAPESLQSFEYSFKSDVWSYGVLLWEVFSLGEVPFGGIQTTDLLEYLQKGHRLIQTDHSTDEVYEIMNLCWNIEPRQRPTFRQICIKFAGLLELATESYGYLAPRSTKPANVQIDNV